MEDLTFIFAEAKMEPVEETEHAPPQDDVKPKVCDYSQVPYVVWVKIFQYLSNNDRRNAAQTCRALNEVFSDPCLWHQLHIRLLPCDSSSHPDKVEVRFFEGFLNNFARYIKELSLVIHKHYIMSRDTTVLKLIRSLQSLLEEHQLRKLHIDIGGQLSVVLRNKGNAESFDRDLESLVTLTEACLKSGALTSFSLDNWPLHSADAYFLKMYEPLLNEPCSNLQELSLFYCDAANSTWLPTNVVPDPSEVLQMIKNLPKMTSLRVRTEMLDDQVLLYLTEADRPRLKNFAVVVTNHMLRLYPVQTVETMSAEKLFNLVTSCSPGLKMQVTFSSRCNMSMKEFWLAPYLPVSEIYFMKFSYFFNEDARLIAQNFPTSLKGLHIYSESQFRADWPLICLIHGCSELRQLTFYGHIKVKTVKKLAKMHRRQWQSFNISARYVITEQHFDGNEHAVIKQRNDGSKGITDLDRFFNSSERKQILDNLCKTVSSILDRHWSLSEFGSLIPPINV